MIRFTNERDAKRLLEIYAPHVKDTAVSFECKLPSIEEFAARIKEISKEYPYLVAVLGNEIVGYGYAHRHMERSAYQWNAELSIYVAPKYHRRGVARAIYSALIDILRLQNIRNVYGGVTVPNAASEGLHESMGFTRLGTYHNAGYKCGAWHDVAWFEKKIGEYNGNPAPFIPLSEINLATVDEILAKYPIKLSED